MKKFLSLCLCVLTLFSLTSCNNSNKILLKGQQGIEESIDIYSDDILAKINAGESFLIMGYLPTCMNCRAFMDDILNPYIKEHNVVIYRTFVSDLMVVDKTIPNTAPNLVIYKDGEVDQVLTFKKNRDVFTEKKAFEKFMKKNFIMPTMLEIDFDTLDKKLADKESFIVYFGWNQCGDCSYMDEAFLNEFLRKNKKTFYYVETDEYRKDKDTKPEEWKKFADKYQFGDYLGGKIPSIVYYESGIKKDMAIYFNDKFDFKINNGKLEKITVLDSYYKDNPNIKKEFTSYLDYQKASEKFFNKKVEQFLKTYLK